MENRQFEFGIMAWHEISHKVKVLPLAELVNSHIRLANYGEGIQSIHFTFMAVEPDVKKGYKPSFRYYPSQKRLSVYQRLDYEIISKASELESLEIIGKSFLDGLQKLERRNIAHFATRSFLIDISQLLEQDYYGQLTA